jgi:hypothetical protein
MADAFCTALKTCCGSLGASGGAYNDASCRDEMKKAFEIAVAAADSGAVGYDPNSAVACANAIKQRQALCVADAGANGGGSKDPVIAACAHVFSGTIPPGGACVSTYECATQGPDDYATCLEDSSGTGPTPTKHCRVTRLNVAPGTTCSMADVDGILSECDATLGTCDLSVSDGGLIGTCKTYPPIGSGCVGALGHAPACDPQVAYCDFSKTQTCVAYPKLGDPCAPGNICPKGAVCDRTAATPTCIPPKAPGGTCTSQECGPNAYCQTAGGPPDGGPISGICTAIPSGTTPRSIFDVPRVCSGLTPLPIPPDIPPLAPLWKGGLR